ncbi:hypothetical protein AN475_13115 [Bacillus amyloliquefaciens]|nr:hypothetical protein AN475_13115 [Bacillus amyloliquefaciens]
MKGFFQVDHLTAQFFIFTRALFGSGQQAVCFENFHDHIQTKYFNKILPWKNEEKDRCTIQKEKMNNLTCVIVLILV